MDWLDKELSLLPSPPPPPGLAERICRRLYIRQRALRFYRLSVWLGWGTFLFGLSLLVLMAQELSVTSGTDVSTLANSALTTLSQAWNAVLTIDLAALSAFWSALQELSLTALSLALSLMTVGAFLMGASQIVRSNVMEQQAI